MSLRLSPLRRAILLLLVIVLTTSGCARIKGVFKDEDENEGVPVEELYDKGHGQMRNGNWSGATVTYRRLLAKLFGGEYDALTVLKMKEVIDQLEMAADAFEHVANTIESIALKEA